MAKREILSLKIVCAKCKEGCAWIGELRQRDEHKQECEYIVQPCDNNCGENVMRKDVESHKENECNRRMVGCCYCDEEREYRCLSGHYETCAKYPVPCPHQCGVLIARECMEMHTSREGECPNSPLQCDFASVGCQFIGTKVKLQNHLERDTISHLSLAMKSLYNVTENLAKSEKKQQETEMKLVRMKDTQLQFQHDITEQLAKSEKKKQETEKKLERIKDSQLQLQNEVTEQLAKSNKKQQETEKKLARMNYSQLQFQHDVTERLAKSEKELAKIKEFLPVQLQFRHYFTGQLTKLEKQQQEKELELTRMTEALSLSVQLPLQCITYWTKNGLDGSLQSSKFVRALLKERNELSFMVSDTIVYLWKIKWSKYVKSAAHPLSKQVRYSDLFSGQQPRSSYPAAIHSAKFHTGISGLQLQIRIYLDKSTFTSAIMCCSRHCDLDLHQTTFRLVTTLLHQESDGDQNRKQQFLMTLPSRSLVTCSFEGDQKEDIPPEQFVLNDELLVTFQFEELA